MRSWLLPLFLLLLDQLSKYVAIGYLTLGHPVVITGFFNFDLVHNTGAAFSLLSDAGGWQSTFFIVVGLVICLGVAGVLWYVPVLPMAMVCGLGLVLGGGLGNWVDRVRWGYVIDFIQWHVGDWYWPTFNLADAFIVAGALLLCFSYRTPVVAKKKVG